MRGLIAKREPVIDGDERRAVTRRLWVALPLAAALSALSLAHRLLGQAPGPPWLPLVLAAPVALWCGWPLYRRAASAVLEREPTMWALVGPGAAAAFAYGALDAGAALVTMVLLGRACELEVRARVRAAPPALRAAPPSSARRLGDDDHEVEVSIEAVRAGDRLRVRAGEVIPADGVVLDGVSAVNEALLRGDSIPVIKRPGSRAIAATTNGTGPLVVRAERLGADTLVSRVAASIAAAQDSVAPFQRRIEPLARWLVTLVPPVALVALVAWATLGPEPRWTNGMNAALAVVFAASPWALALATPISTLVAIGKAAAVGVVFRDAEAIERLRDVDVLVVDKTGTLTEGKPRVVSVRPTVGFDKQQVLRLAASLERASRHPLAAAIVAAAEEAGVALHDIESFRALPGMGVSGTIGNRSLLFGSPALMEDGGVALDDLPRRAEPLRAQGQTVMFLAVNGRPAGLVGVADPVKPRTQEAVATLHREGVRIVLLTGDGRGTAEALGHAIGVDEIHAEKLPAQKLELVTRLRARGHIVAMTGDGVGDAPALACADVAIATGTAAAPADAAVTMLERDLHGIAWARVLSRLTTTSFKQNLTFAIAYNVVAIASAAGLMFPVAGTVPSPTLSAFAMACAALAVLGNALRLRAMRF